MGNPLNITTPYGKLQVDGLDNSGLGAVSAFSNLAKGAQQDPAYDPTHNTLIAMNKTVLAGNVSFEAHIGDIAYADELAKVFPKAQWTNGPLVNSTISTSGAEWYEAAVEAFYDQIQPITSQVPYMVLPGNHEATCSNGKNIDLCYPGQLNFTGYNAHWAMPSAQSGGVKNMWYSFDYGMAHYIMLDGETDFQGSPSGGPTGFVGTNVDTTGQGPFITPNATNLYLQWVERDLASVNRTTTPWIIAGIHRPWYVSGSDVASSAQVAFEPLFLKYDVDFVFHGHVHNYQRQCAVHYSGVCDANGYDNPTAPVYIIEGDGGHFGGQDDDDNPEGYGGLGSVGNSNYSFPANSQLSPFTQYYDENYGYGVLTFHNSTFATYSHIVSASGQVTDSVTLFKDHVYAQPLGSVKSNTVQCGAGLTVCGNACYNAAQNQYTCVNSVLQQVPHTLSNLLKRN